ncbi:hypothetical protein TNCV_4306781 [Trichonephila clavipes]|nr:hypothetical protein TNCV_4306781 [Trichonephila clavipes]
MLLISSCVALPSPDVVRGGDLVDYLDSRGYPKAVEVRKSLTPSRLFLSRARTGDTYHPGSSLVGHCENLLCVIGLSRLISPVLFMISNN